MTDSTSTTARSGVDTARFASRRTLVLRRFLRNRPAVGALALLVLMFAGCYLLPPLLPYSYTDLDYYALQQPPSPQHWFGTNALGQDLLAQTLRGMQKSMLIGVAVAFISTVIAATVGSIAGYFGGWRDRTLMWLVDLLLVVPSFILIAIVTPRTRESGTILWLILLLAAFSWMISSRIVRGLTMSLRDREFVVAARYMGCRTGASSCATSSPTSPRSSSSTPRSTWGWRCSPKPGSASWDSVCSGPTSRSAR